MSLEKYLFEFFLFAVLTPSYRLDPDNLNSIVNKLGLSIRQVDSKFMKGKFSEFDWTFESDYYVLDFEQFAFSVRSSFPIISPPAQQPRGISRRRQSVLPRERAALLPRLPIRAGASRRSQALRRAAVPLRRSSLRLLALPDDQPCGIPPFSSRAAGRRRAGSHLGGLGGVHPRGESPFMMK